MMQAEALPPSITRSAAGEVEAWTFVLSVCNLIAEHLCLDVETVAGEVCEIMGEMPGIGSAPEMSAFLRHPDDVMALASYVAERALGEDLDRPLLALSIH